MQFKNELMAIRCDLDAAEFDGLLADLFARSNRDRTTDALLCDWPSAREFCRHVRGRLKIDDDGIADEMILRRLTGLRKRGGMRRGPHGTFTTLKAALEEVGIGVEPDEFRTSVMATFVKLYGRWTVDGFLANWRLSAHFCGVVASCLEMKRDIATDNLVLKTLLNGRRKGKLNRLHREAIV